MILIEQKQWVKHQAALLCQGGMNCINSNYVLYYHTQKRKKKNPPVSLKNVLNEAVKMTDFIKPQPLNMTFNILCNKMQSTQKAFLPP